MIGIYAMTFTGLRHQCFIMCDLRTQSVPLVQPGHLCSAFVQYGLIFRDNGWIVRVGVKAGVYGATEGLAYALKLHTSQRGTVEQSKKLEFGRRHGWTYMYTNGGCFKVFECTPCTCGRPRRHSILIHRLTISQSFVGATRVTKVVVARVSADGGRSMLVIVGLLRPFILGRILPALAVGVACRNCRILVLVWGGRGLGCDVRRYLRHWRV